MSDADIVVIGSGPNGLVAAIALARKGWSVTVLERAPVAGGAVASAELTLPGYIHDTYSGFYGLLHATPVFREFDLGPRVPWVHYDVPIGAATDPSTAAVIRRDRDQTVEAFGSDGDAWRELTAWWDRLGTRFFDQMLAPVGAIGPALRFLRAARIRGGIDAARTFLTPVAEIARQRFSAEVTRALFSSGITHSDLSVEQAGSTPMALIICMLAQTVGMPAPAGGAGVLARALVTLLEEAHGEVLCGDAATRIVIERGRAIAVETASGAVHRARHAVLADTGPLALVHDLAGDEHFPTSFLDGLRRFHYGTGIFKVDVALRAPLQWRAPELNDCATVHLTGGLADMARASFEAHDGLLPARPLLIVGQHCIADPSRAPAGAATLWIEMHTPPVPRADAARLIDCSRGWASAKEPFTERVFDLLEEHAPGARSQIAGVAVRTPVDLEAENPNLVGGDLAGGSSALDMQLVFRPVPGWFRYRTPVHGLYLCSASTHPGGGVHGMCGWNAAQRVMGDMHRPRELLRAGGGARRAPRKS